MKSRTQNKVVGTYLYERMDNRKQVKEESETKKDPQKENLE